MDKEKRVRIINGEHKGKDGVLTSMLWGCNIAIVTTDNREEIAINPLDMVSFTR